MAWFFYALSSIVFFTTLNLLQRVLAVDSKNQRAMAVVFNLIAGLLATSIFVFTGSYKNFTLPTNYSAWIALGVAAFMYAVFERGRFYAAKLLDASVFTIIGNVSVVVAFIGALFLYSETLTINKLLGTLLVLSALILVSCKKRTKEKTSISAKGILVGIVVSTFLGLGWMLDKMGATYFNSNTYSILIWLIPIPLIYFPYIEIRKLRDESKVGSWKVFVLAGVNVVGYLLQLKALELQEATRVIPIVQTSSLFTVLFGILLLKERENILRKIIAGTIAFTGVYFLL